MGAPGRRKRSLPVPGTAPVAGLGSGTVAEAQWYQQQLQWQQTQLNALARGKRSPQGAAAVPVTPGNIPGLVPGSAAAAQWWAAQIAHQGQLAHHVGKRQAAIPLTPGNVPGLVPGSEAARQWWTNQLIWQQHQLAAAGGKKRSAAQYPAGVSAASCPNYPFCNLAPVVPLGYVNTAGYPAGVSAAVCPGYPYC